MGGIHPAPALPGGLLWDFEPCSMVRGAKPPQEQSPADSIWSSFGITPNPSRSTAVLWICPHSLLFCLILPRSIRSVWVQSCPV